MIRLLLLPVLLLSTSLAEAGGPASADPEPNTPAYEKLLEESAAFRARIVRRECDPIREAELRRLCINSVVAPGADSPRSLQYGAGPGLGY